jgi:peroxiredoxin
MNERPIEPVTFRRLGKGKPVVVVLLALSIVAIVLIAALAAVLAPTHKGRRVTLPPADRAASPALREAASALGFRPTRHADSTERKPASAAPDPPSGLLPIGTVAPDFALQTPVGKTVRLSALRGRPVLLEFFAAWCPHCAAEAPHLRRLATAFAKRASFVAVNADSEDAASVFAFHAWFGLPFPALVDAGSHPVKWPGHGRVGPVSSRYRVGSFPTFYVLDARGRIVWRSAGEQPDAKLRQELDRATVSR